MNGHQALREVVIVSAVGATPSLSLNTTAEHASRLIAISFDHLIHLSLALHLDAS